MSIEGLVAVTYTTKARAELESRLRQVLVQEGLFARADALPTAYLGTVHAVCLRLLQEFALEAGISPDIDGLPQEAARHLLQESLEAALSPELRTRLDDTARAIELNWDGRTRRHDWITPVEQIMTLARSNRLNAEDLRDMARRSNEGLQQLLRPVAADGVGLERALADALEESIGALVNLNDGQKNTSDVLGVLRDALDQLQRGRLPWSQWCKLSKVKPGKRAMPLVEAVLLAAAEYDIHPRFRTEICACCDAIFDAASVGLRAYADWKAQRGLVDYVDMIDLALSALDVPDVQRELGRRLELLVVDEFQDTSPIQLALFARFHQFTRRSIWVGDWKQCIFEYAGADPTLMDSVTRWVNSHGGKTEVLPRNFRSRPELVESISLLFTRALERHGQSSGEVVAHANREALPQLESLPPFGVWKMNSKTERALAAGVARLLSEPGATTVVDRETGLVRSLRPGDVAVLVATNKEAEDLAAALAELGIASVLARTGLMRTPEGTVLSAALGYLIDAADTLATAELEALHGFGGMEQEAWLAEKITSKATNGAPSAHAELLLPLDALRPELPRVAPSEVLDRVIAALDLVTKARRWPNPDQRLANLDALRALAAAYEDRSTYLREAASVGGLLRYFAESQIAIRQQDEERARDEQHVSINPDAVVLSTYHKAKGLEWPVVVLGSLDREGRRHAFSVTPEMDRDTFDAADPLGQRWIRYWPWPLGQQKDAAIRERAAESEVGRRITERDSRERVRLLYVGFTRARDHLILAVTVTGKGVAKTAWLDELSDADGPLLTLPSKQTSDATLDVRVSVSTVHRALARVWNLGEECVESKPREDPARIWFAPTPSALGAHPGYVIKPSDKNDEILSGAEFAIASITSWNRMPFTSTKDKRWDDVGTAIHAFLASDTFELSGARRELIARRILAAAELEASFDPAALLAASDNLRRFVERRWPGARWHREVPVIATVKSEHGARQLHGVVDLLLETEMGDVIVDHKSFPGSSQQWEQEATKYAPQLCAYAHALKVAGRNVIARLVHFTIGGGVVELVERSAI
jgi:ATP-dependent exoDNAse (exonuclease V) beta subunit